MTGVSPELFLLMIAVTGAVIVVSALLSGLVERSPVPQVAVFLALGAVIGPAGLGLFDAGTSSPILRFVATLSLVLVLFTDAVSLDIAEVRQHKLLAFLALGPGTVTSAALIGVAAWWLHTPCRSRAVNIKQASPQSCSCLRRILPRKASKGPPA